MESASKNTLTGVLRTFPEIAFGNFLDPPRGGVNSDASKGYADHGIVLAQIIRHVRATWGSRGEIGVRLWLADTIQEQDCIERR